MSDITLVFDNSTKYYLDVTTKNKRNKLIPGGAIAITVPIGNFEKSDRLSEERKLQMQTNVQIKEHNSSKRVHFTVVVDAEDFEFVSKKPWMYTLKGNVLKYELII